MIYQICSQKKYGDNCDGYDSESSLWETKEAPLTYIPTHDIGHDIPSWKPYSLRLPYLIFLIILTVAFIIGIELIFQKSQRDGALTYSLVELSPWQVFVSQYMGTVASVIYGILISLSDLDAKRLEPWFQLSRPDGATAANSMLLCYPFDFLPLIPFKAAKRGYVAFLIKLCSNESGSTPHW